MEGQSNIVGTSRDSLVMMRTSEAGIINALIEGHLGNWYVTLFCSANEDPFLPILSVLDKTDK
jgi:hypothetical protein